MTKQPGWVRSLAFQVGLIAGAILLYFGVRGLTEGDETEAIASGRHLLRLEARLGLDVEASLQHKLLDHDWVVTLANWIYIWGHWPVIIASLVWLFARHRKDYVLLRNAMFISGAIGLVIFVTYPVAPPRLLPGFVDTVTERSHSYRVLQPPGLVNKYAALPSLHFGWNLLVGMVIYRVAHSRLAQMYAIVGPILMASAVVITANHYVVDAIAGGLIAAIGLVLALRLEKATGPFPKTIGSESQTEPQVQHHERRSTIDLRLRLKTGPTADPTAEPSPDRCDRSRAS
ncbi:MAG: hypothetical protein ACI8TP_000948 [Acidimicrobiales bacterium]|jgi:hypothetical protein